MKLAGAALVVVAYVMGTKAGNDRYAQIVEVAQRASRRLDQYGARDDAEAERLVGDRGDGGAGGEGAPR